MLNNLTQILVYSPGFYFSGGCIEASSQMFPGALTSTGFRSLVWAIRAVAGALQQ